MRNPVKNSFLLSLLCLQATGLYACKFSTPPSAQSDPASTAKAIVVGSNLTPGKDLEHTPGFEQTWIQDGANCEILVMPESFAGQARFGKDKTVKVDHFGADIELSAPSGNPSRVSFSLGFPLQSLPDRNTRQISLKIRVDEAFSRSVTEAGLRPGLNMISEEENGNLSFRRLDNVTSPQKESLATLVTAARSFVVRNCPSITLN